MRQRRESHRSQADRKALTAHQNSRKLKRRIRDMTCTAVLCALIPEQLFLASETAMTLETKKNFTGFASCSRESCPRSTEFCLHFVQVSCVAFHHKKHCYIGHESQEDLVKLSCNFAVAGELNTQVEHRVAQFNPQVKKDTG